MRPRFKGRKKDIKEENQALIQNSEMKRQRQILNHMCLYVHAHI